MDREVALLVNPTAGRGRGRRAGDAAGQRLRAAGFRVDELVGRDAAEAADLAAGAAASGVDAVVAVGGDGMVHLVVQALAGTSVPFGIVPAGTGNDFARALGLPLRDPAAAADVVVAGHLRRVDLGRSEGTWFTCVVAAGFDARVNERANSMRWPPGRSRYTVALAIELGVFAPRPYVLELDGQRWETGGMLVAVGNTPSYGGGMRVTPGALLDDGLLDVLVLAPLPRSEFVRVFPRVYRGTHIDHPAVQVRRAREVVVDAPGIVAYVDGERLGPLPRRFTAVPGAVAVLVPGTRTPAG